MIIVCMCNGPGVQVAGGKPLKYEPSAMNHRTVVRRVGILVCTYTHNLSLLSDPVVIELLNWYRLCTCSRIVV